MQAASTVSRRDIMIKFGVRAVILLPIVATTTTSVAAQTYNGCVNC